MAIVDRRMRSFKDSVTLYDNLEGNRIILGHFGNTCGSGPRPDPGSSCDYTKFSDVRRKTKVYDK